MEFREIVWIINIYFKLNSIGLFFDITTFYV